MFHLLINSPNAYNRQEWSRLKPGAQNSIWVFHLVSRDQLFAPSSTAFLGALAMKCIRCRAATSWIGSLICDAGISHGQTGHNIKLSHHLQFTSKSSRPHWNTHAHLHIYPHKHRHWDIYMFVCMKNFVYIILKYNLRSSWKLKLKVYIYFGAIKHSSAAHFPHNLY